jgi:hypothetical protein
MTTSSPVRAIFEKALGHTKLDVDVQKKIVDELMSEFDGWFMSAENQAPLATFEKTLVKTAFAWLLDQISK